MVVGPFEHCGSKRRKSLRCKPAMAAGITDHVWDVRELLEAA
jgi:hypothetical protein